MSVIAHHLIWTNYGTWLPNDPRGSGSQMVYTAELCELGQPHCGRCQTQPPRQSVREFYESAEPKLQYPMLRFNTDEIAAIADAFAETIRTNCYAYYACAIMPDHAHMVIRKYKHPAETVIELLQSASRLRFSSPPNPPSPSNLGLRRTGTPALWRTFEFPARDRTRRK